MIGRAARRFALAMLTAGIAALALGAVPASAADSGTCASPAAYTGAGTVGDPMLIGTPGQLMQLRNTSAHWNKVIRLTADIDMTGCTWGSSFGPSPVTFTGTFDGAGHVVRGFAVSTTTPTYAGFIPYLGSGGTVRDLGIEGQVTATNSGSTAEVAVGGLVGFTFSSTAIQRSYFKGSIDVSASASPGGYCFMPPCPATASVNAGGLVGYLQGAVTDSYARADIHASATATGSGSTATLSAGGVVGNQGLGATTRAYSTSTIAASTSASMTTVRTGGIAGSFSPSYATQSGLAWDTTVAPGGNGAGSGGPVGTGKTTAQMTTAATFGPSGLGWDITDGYSAATVWSICPRQNNGYPFLSAFATAQACTEGPAPVPDPASEPGSSGGALPPSTPATESPSGATAATARPALLRVQARQPLTIALGRRSSLVDGVRSNGMITGVNAWCEFRGVRLAPSRAQRLCGLRVGAGAAGPAGANERRDVVISATPRCTTGLTVRVRVGARTSSATSTAWNRTWRVTSPRAVRCTIVPKMAVTG